MPKQTRRPVQLLHEYRKRSGLFYADGGYVIDIQMDDGRRVRRKCGTDKVRALRMLDKLVAELSEQERDADDPPLADFLLSTFLPTQRRLKSYAFSVKCVKALVRFLEAEASGLRIGDVNVTHLNRLRLFYGHCKPKTRNLYAQKLKQALYLAVKTGHLDKNPLADERALPVDNLRSRFLAMGDFARLMGAASNTDARNLFLVMALTGLRPSNVRLLTAGEVADEMIRIPGDKMKNGRQAIVPASRYARELLADRARRVNDPDALLFPARGTTDRPKSDDNLSRSYRQVVRRLDGLAWSTLYDLRHFFASELGNKHGATEMQIAKLLCHQGQTVTRRYVHIDIEDCRPFVDAHGERVRVALGGLPTLTTDEDDAVIRV